MKLVTLALAAAALALSAGMASAHPAHHRHHHPAPHHRMHHRAPHVLQGFEPGVPGAAGPAAAVSWVQLPAAPGNTTGLS